MNFIDNAFQIFARFEKFCGTEEFEKFRLEALAFLQSIKDKPVNEQSALFMEKYGHVIQLINTSTMKRINLKLGFFVVLAVISLTAGVILFLANLHTGY